MSDPTPLPNWLEKWAAQPGEVPWPMVEAIVKCAEEAPVTRDALVAFPLRCVVEAFGGFWVVSGYGQCPKRHAVIMLDKVRGPLPGGGEDWIELEERVGIHANPQRVHYRAPWRGLTPDVVRAIIDAKGHA